MSDTPTPASTTEKSIVVTNAQLCRLWTFTYISIGLNVLILALFLVCAIVHHHDNNKRHHKHGHGGRHERGDSRGGFGRGGGQGFHRHGGWGGGQQGWGQRGGFSGDRQGGGGGGFRGNGFGGGGPGNMDRGRGPGMGGNRGPGMMQRGGFGMGGPGGGDRRGGGPGAPADPSKMTDMILNRLSTQLTLTDDEKAKIKPLILEQATQMQKDMEAQRLARQKAMEDTKAKIKALLTADQQKQLDAIPLPGEKPPGDATTAPAAAK